MHWNMGGTAGCSPSRNISPLWTIPKHEVNTCSASTCPLAPLLSFVQPQKTRNHEPSPNKDKEKGKIWSCLQRRQLTKELLVKPRALREALSVSSFIISWNIIVIGTRKIGWVRSQLKRALFFAKWHFAIITSLFLGLKCVQMTLFSRFNIHFSGMRLPKMTL